MIIDVATRSLIRLKFYLISYFKIALIYTSNQNIMFHITILCHCMPIWVLQLQFLITLDHLVDIVKKQILTLLIYYYRLSVLMEKLKRQKLPMAAPMALTRQKMEPLRKMRKKETKKRETRKKT